MDLPKFTPGRAGSPLPAATATSFSASDLNTIVDLLNAWSRAKITRGETDTIKLSEEGQLILQLRNETAGV